MKKSVPKRTIDKIEKETCEKNDNKSNINNGKSSLLLSYIFIIIILLSESIR